MKPHLRRAHPGNRGRAILRRTLDEARKSDSEPRSDAPSPVPRPHLWTNLAQATRRFLFS